MSYGNRIDSALENGLSINAFRHLKVDVSSVWDFSRNLLTPKNN